MMVKYYKNSPSLALKTIYSDHKWMLWRFNPVKRGYWIQLMEDEIKMKKLLDWLGEKFFIKNLHDWYRIPILTIKKWISIGTTHNMSKMLRMAYPQHNWDANLLNRLIPVKAYQRELFIALQELFPDYRMT